MQKIKICSDCRRVLGEDSFGNHYDNRDDKTYITSFCKRCQRNKSKLWREDNIEHCKQYRIDNKEYMIDYKKQYWIDNKKYINKKNKEWQQENKDKANNIKARYRAKKRNATPDNANLSIIKFYYTVCDTMAGYEVDHYQPLNKDGLHHEDNLQILLMPLNREKKDKWPLTEEEKVRYKGFRL